MEGAGGTNIQNHNERNLGLSRSAGLILGAIRAGCSLACSRGTLAYQDAETSPVCLVHLVCLVYSVIVLLNQIHETDQIDQMDRINQWPLL